ncbi:UV DNA damage repair endonuclease UvsE [Paenibacillus koleovorans]|uniref:UV DNA damage repair endonuclease UvsE n=1 Tax=Paenibacillus koleovorans TaxID=121608 RepID=UPI000FD80FC0|nr:UV DNA damage repair endonuclease UvsE [Paenibacillus koleovorans]
MIVRFGYVAMSTIVENASPSRTMTATNFQKLDDREAAVRRLERIAEENLRNTLRLLRHNRAHDVHLYRLSSKLIPLLSHELLSGWDPFPVLEQPFRDIGDYAKEHGMRLSFHPDHFTVLSSPREEVLRNSYLDLDIHVRMLEEMGLDERAKCNIHIGGAYGNKETAAARFVDSFKRMTPRIQRRMTLENDDKTFTARETLEVCEQLGDVPVPMVLDIHHHQVNTGGDLLDEELWTRICRTWANQRIPPKIHASSPKSEKDPRGHADYVNADQVLTFLQLASQTGTPKLDVMLEAKMKDGALFRLMDDLRQKEGLRLLDQATVEIL